MSVPRIMPCAISNMILPLLGYCLRCSHYRACQYRSLKVLRVTRQPEVVTGKDPRHIAGCGYDVPFQHSAIGQGVGIIDALVLDGRIPAEPTL